MTITISEASDGPQPADDKEQPAQEPLIRRRGTDEEVTAMQMSELLDLANAAAADGEDIPCRDYDAELWFAEKPDDVEFAKSLCGLCPARRQCLAGALDREEPWGVWGGQLFVQGAIVARKRPRGRPRKDAVAA